MSLKLLVVVPCGQAKIWEKEPDHGPVKARNAYIGMPFRVNKTFAKKFADRWVILSAKYGFIDPDFVISKNYNVTFKKLSTNPISVNTLKEQLKLKNLDNYDVVIALGGKDYSSTVRQVFMKVSKVIAPTEGLPIGKAMGCVKSLIKLEKTQMLKVIGGLASDQV